MMSATQRFTFGWPIRSCTCLSKSWSIGTAVTSGPTSSTTPIGS